METLRNIVAGGLACGSTVADVKVRAVLWTATVAAAVRIAASPIGFRNASQERLRKRLLDFADQPFSLALMHGAHFQPVRHRALTSQPRRANRHQVLHDNAPADVTLKAVVAFVTRALHAKLVFESADARFNSGSPALARENQRCF